MRAASDLVTIWPDKAAFSISGKKKCPPWSLAVFREILTPLFFKRDLFRQYRGGHLGFLQCPYSAMRILQIEDIASRDPGLSGKLYQIDKMFILSLDPSIRLQYALREDVNDCEEWCKALEDPPMESEDRKNPTYCRHCGQSFASNNSLHRHLRGECEKHKRATSPTTLNAKSSSSIELEKTSPTPSITDEILINHVQFNIVRSTHTDTEKHGFAFRGWRNATNWYAKITSR